MDSFFVKLQKIAPSCSISASPTSLQRYCFIEHKLSHKGKNEKQKIKETFVEGKN